MPSLRRLATLALLWLLPVSATAATYDPDLKWRTLRTEHFRIHFHQGIEQVADEFSVIVEEVYATNLKELRWRPKGGRISVTLVDRTDSANGSAGTVPYNQIIIYVTAPQEDSNLEYYENWDHTIATHELTHIMHIDANHGIAAVARAVVGRVASTNRVSPWWMVEGLATFEETRLTTGGRGRAPLADMVKRTSTLEGDFPPMDTLDGIQPDWPGGNLRYLFGQDFMQFVADHQGRDVWTKWIHTYGSSIPYVLPGKPIFGKSLTRLYHAWRADLERKYGAIADGVREEGLREGRLISVPNQSCHAPAFSPDGDKLVWTCSDLRRGSAIWLSDGDGYAGEPIVKRRGAKNFTWRLDSKAFVYAGTHTVNRFNTWSDVYLYHLGDKRVTSLTSGARARDPDFSPDGSRLMMVTNRAQDGQLEVLTVDRRRQALTKQKEHIQFSTPRYSPDGKALAVSVWEKGRRDLWIYGLDGKPLRRLTSDAPADRDPEWSADGKYLFFSSDRGGIPNIYAIEVADERLWQVTNVLTGATKPSLSPDGKKLAYSQFSHDGWDVRLLDIDPAQFIDRGYLPRALDSTVALRDVVGGATPAPATVALDWQGDRLRRNVPGAPADLLLAAASPRAFGMLQSPDESVDSLDQGVSKDVFGEEEEYPFRITPRRYNPFLGLFPRYWLPYIQSSPYEPRAPFDKLGLSLVVSAETGTADPLRHVGWSAGISYRTDANFVSFSGSFTWNRYIPVYSIGFSRRAVPYGRIVIPDPGGQVDEEGNPLLVYSDDRYWEERTQGWFSVSYPYTSRTWVFATYSFTERKELFDLPADAYLPLVPARGFIGVVEGGWRYSWDQPTSYQISTEKGRIFSLVAGIRGPWLGTFLRDDSGNLEPFTQVQVTSEIREYVVNPLIPNHVLAMRAAGGLTLGRTDFFGSYQLGGSYGDGAFYSTPDESRMVRGYPLAADVGDMYWLAGLEYRFPILRIERGLWMLPAYLRYVSASVYIDSGNAFTEVEEAPDLVRGTLAGAGAELRFGTLLGWATGITARVGVGVALNSDLDGDGRISQGDADGNGRITASEREGGYRFTDPGAYYFRVGGSF